MLSVRRSRHPDGRRNSPYRAIQVQARPAHPVLAPQAQSLAGKAELQKAEYTRQVAVLEAQAKKDSAQQLADAEIIRATGVAKANQIIGDSLKDNREYLQYLYITGLEEGSNKGNVTIYVPTEGGMPVPTLQMSK